MNYYIQGDAAKADQIKAAFEAKGFIPRIAPMYYGSESVLFFTGIGNYIYETSSPWVMNIIKTHPDYKELELPVEPKFKVGDWLVYKDGDTFCGDLKTVQVRTVEKDRYIFTHGTKSSQRFIDSECRLWTIADAKDGDVLSYQDEIFIARIDRGLSANVAIDYDCCYDGNSFILDSFYSLTVEELKKVYPATKEQRDLLFKKMKEAGYEWDADKKELHKIHPHYDISNFHAGMPVLQRSGNDEHWDYDIFSRYLDNNCSHPFILVGCYSRQCIPFNDDTKHLLGTTDMPREEYINW